jgi:hypothetical protein
MLKRSYLGNYTYLLLFVLAMFRNKDFGALAFYSKNVCVCVCLCVCLSLMMCGLCLMSGWLSCFAKE